MINESSDVIKMAAGIIFIAALVIILLRNVQISQVFSGSAMDKVEESTQKNYAYLQNFVDTEKVVSVAEAYALFGYNIDLISDLTCSCALCSDGTPGTPREEHNKSLSDLCLRNHLHGNCKVKITKVGDEYHMFVYDV